MQAAIFPTLGGPEVIQLATIPAPVVGPNDVLVQVLAVAVNHVDTFVRSGGFKTALAEPHVVGRDMVGTVLQCGSAVTQFTVGQQVWTNSMGYDGRPGVTSDQVAVPVERLYPVPVGVDPIQLVAAVHSAATASIVLNAEMHARTGETLLVEGAAGHVGRKFVALGKIMGLHVITTSAPRDFAQLRQLGSDQCLDYHADLADGVTELVDHVVDTSGQVALQDNLALLAEAGDVTLITAPADNQFQFAVRQFYTSRQRLNGFVISHATQEELATAATQLNACFAAGKLLEDDVLLKSFADVAWAHQALADGTVHRQKIVLTPKQK